MFEHHVKHVKDLDPKSLYRARRIRLRQIPFTPFTPFTGGRAKGVPGIGIGRSEAPLSRAMAAGFATDRAVHHA